GSRAGRGLVLGGALADDQAGRGRGHDGDGVGGGQRRVDRVVRDGDDGGPVAPGDAQAGLGVGGRGDRDDVAVVHGPGELVGDRLVLGVDFGDGQGYLLEVVELHDSCLLTSRTARTFRRSLVERCRVHGEQQEGGAFQPLVEDRRDRGDVGSLAGRETSALGNHGLDGELQCENTVLGGHIPPGIVSARRYFVRLATSRSA